MPNLILWATAGFITGVWCAKLVRVEITVLAVAAAILLGVAWRQMKNHPRYLAATILGLFAVVGMIRFHHAETLSPLDISRFAGQTATLSGRIAEQPLWCGIDEETVKVKYTVEAVSVNISGKGTEAAEGGVMISLTQPKDQPRASYGDKVTVTGKILALHGYQNPGQMDTVHSLRLQGVNARMAVTGRAFSVVPARSQNWQSAIAGLRQKVARVISEAMAPEDAALLTGILFGGYYGIRQEVVHDFAATGLVHILSVSGTHIALVAGVAAWLCGWLKLRRTITAGVAAGFIVIYALFAGLSPPVVRSVVMGLIALAAVGLGREKASFQALVATALGMMAYQPGLLYDISFQLSFGATAGLVLLYEKIVGRLAFLPPFAAGAIAVTAAAQLGVLPFLAWYFNSFPLSSFLANIVIVPPIEAIVVIGLAGSLAGTLVPLLGKILLVFTAMLIGIVVKLTSLIAAIPGSSLYVPPVGVAGGLAYYLALAWGFRLVPDSLPSPSDLWRRWPMPTSIVLALVITAGLFQLYYPRDMQVHFIDVGQGDATLIITPHHRAVLVDSGGSGAMSDFDVGERVVVPYLKHYGVSALDYLILTHGHKDHAGGAAGVAAAFPVRSVLLARENFTPSVQTLIRTVHGQGIIPAFTGQAVELDGVSFRVVHAVGDAGANRSNEASSVLKVSYGSFSFLITGDLEARGEQEMLAMGCAPVTVLKVGHHGARTSSTSEFLHALAPKYAVISVGYNNQFGHPHPETLRRLEGVGARLFRTDYDGAVVFATDGEALKVEPYIKDIAR